MTHPYWRPIETAPTNGTVIDIFVAGIRHTNVRYVAGGPNESNDWVSVDDDLGIVADLGMSMEDVTHWAPVPPNPNEE